MTRLIFIATVLYSCITLGQLEYHSDRIKMMDIEILQQLVSKNLQKLERKEDSPMPLIKQSLEVVLAQPDQRLAASNIFTQLQNLSGGDDTFAQILNEIAEEGINALKEKSKDSKVLRNQNTYLYIMNHMLAEIQGSKDKKVYKDLIEKVRDADIRVSDSLISYRLLNSMAQVENPSKFAKAILPKKDPWWKFW